MMVAQACKATVAILLAADSESKAISAWHKWGAKVPLIALAIVLVLAVWILTPGILRRWRNSRRRLFAVLCRTHGIGWSDRRLIVRAARTLGLSHPNQLFVAPEKFNGLLKDHRWQADHDRLRELADRLFSTRPRSASA